MATTPPAGWYPDPSDAASDRYWDGEAWSASTRPRPEARLPTSSPRKRWAIAAVVVGLILAAGTAIGIAATRGDDAPQGETGDVAADVRVPTGYELVQSPSLAIAFPVPAAWTDVLSAATTRQFLSDLGPHPAFAAELAGAWETPLASDGAFSSVWVSAFSYHKGVADVEFEVTGYAQASVKNTGADSVEKTRDEAFTSAHGYTGWRTDYHLVFADVTVDVVTIGVATGANVVIVSAVSSEDPSTWEADAVALAENLVIARSVVEADA